MKREVGIESSGHLQFHLGKLNGLVSTNAEGSYTLTDDGREAIRVLKAIPTTSDQIPLVSTTPKRRTNWLVPILAIIVIAIIAGAGTGYLLGNMNEHTTTITSTSTQVTTVQTIDLSRSDSNYSFAIRLNGSTFVRGQEISLFYNFTNISGQYQRVQEVNPLVIPVVYNENGSIALFLTPKSFEFSLAPNNFLPNGFSLSGKLLIPTSNMAAGQKYVLSVGPLIGPFLSSNETYGFLARYYPYGESLMINTTITIA